LPSLAVSSDQRLRLGTEAVAKKLLTARDCGGIKISVFHHIFRVMYDLPYDLQEYSITGS